MRRLAPLLLASILPAAPARAEQDLLPGADMSSAAMTRAGIEAMIAGADGKPIDLSDRALAGLDLSGLDLRGANLRTARLNGADLRGARRVGARMFGITAREADPSGETGPEAIASLPGQAI